MSMMNPEAGLLAQRIKVESIARGVMDTLWQNAIAVSHRSVLWGSYRFRTIGR